MNGTITMYGIKIEVEISDTYEDGFSWKVDNIQFDEPMSLEDLAEFMEEHHDDIDAEVKKEYAVWLEDEKTDDQLIRAGII